MRLFIHVGVVALSLAGASVEADPAMAMSARSAQVISMAESTNVDPFVSTSAPEKPPISVPAAEVPINQAPLKPFEVHDLSRKWVAFQMAGNFASARTSADRQPSRDEDDPFAYVGVATLPSEGNGTIAGQIAVPAWMRGGAPMSSLPRNDTQCRGPLYRSTGFLSAEAEKRRESFYGMMSNIACEFGIPVGLFDAMIIQESRYKPAVFSPKNAFGLTQLMAATAAGLGVNRYDVADNLRGGARYLREQLDRFGQVHLALAAYNAGPGRVRGGAVPRIAETQAYVSTVLTNWRRLAAPVSVSPQQLASDAERQPADPQMLGRRATVSTF